MKDTRLRQMDALFKALADPTRLRILGLLLAGEICVCHIHESLGISQPKASRHLAYLRRAGLVTTQRAGLWVHYRLASPADHVLQALVSTVSHCLTHLESTARDRRRLEKKIGCCPTLDAAARPQLPCCAASPASGPPNRS